MPPSLGYEKPNPAIAFETSPFVVAPQTKKVPASTQNVRERTASRSPASAAVKAAGAAGGSSQP